MRQMWKVVAAVSALLVAPEITVGAQENPHLTMRQVEAVYDSGEKHPPLTEDPGPAADGQIIVVPGHGQEGSVYELQPAIASGFQVERVDPQPAASGTTWNVHMELGGPAAVRLQNLTSQLACTRDRGDEVRSTLAIVYDGKVISAPAMAPEVECGTGIADGAVTVNLASQQDAEELARALGWNGTPMPPLPIPGALDEDPAEDNDRSPLIPILGAAGVLIVIVGVVTFLLWRKRPN